MSERMTSKEHLEGTLLRCGRLAALQAPGSVSKSSGRSGPVFEIFSEMRVKSHISGWDIQQATQEWMNPVSGASL